eukprot:gb/GFBE01026464.1/.p1 GENE.gb/GFBE01026464.1/~~gb/GFBE01026464.1/.p1  ORF type:complete len:610 (+),score=170.36 gb/GFBE01026464.1/:1-1830(+)
MAPGGERRSARDRDASSDSQRDRKRKRDKVDKKDKKDRRDRGGDDRKGKKREVETWNREDGYGYGGGHDDGERRQSKRQAAPGDYRDDRDRQRRDDRDDHRGGRDRRGDQRDDRRGQRREVEEEPVREEPPAKPEPVKPARDWREEADEEGEDLRDESDDEEAAARKLEESRKRRAAMMAQAPKPEKKDDKKEPEEPARTLSAGDAKEGEAGADEADGDDAKSKAKGKGGEDDGGGGDMFDLTQDAKALKSGVQRSQNIGLTGASTDDWDDDDGYYIAQVGEMLEERYHVSETLAGKGVFSNVVKAKDTKTAGEPMVALKIIRSNDMMKKAAEREVEILQTLNNADKGDKRHIIRLIDTFYYRKHIFLVFECMAEDLRGAVKSRTKNRGMSLPAVKAYTKQLLIGVRHMHKHNIIHADLKPDNILISADNNIVKLCDFGTAFETKDVSVSPYLMSRFYRPAEVILGCEYGIAVDVWALATTLFEIFTGKTLLQGKTNNDMLKKIMDLKGKIPKNVIKKGAVWKQHFDDNLDFKYIDKDSMSGEEITRVITDNSAKKEMKEYILDRVGPDKQKSQEREDQQYVKSRFTFQTCWTRCSRWTQKNVCQRRMP